MDHPIFYLHPGYIRSDNDLQMHYITSYKLIKCYELDKTQCTIKISRDGERGHRLSSEKGIHLFPRKRGDYKQHLARCLNDGFSTIT